MGSGDDEETRVDGAASKAIKDQLRPGSAVGAFVVERMIGAGGGGRVYLARHNELGVNAAIKVLNLPLTSSVRMVERFFREALTANMIRHPNIVKVFEFGELPGGRPFYAMEYLEGRDLKGLLRERGRFSPAEALVILEPVCAALDAAHTVGIVHRDLKASNIHVGSSTDPAKYTIKLLDFGIAKMLEPPSGTPALTVAGTRLGTSATMSPEQIDARPVTPASDVYALGVVLYQMLTGSYPFTGEDRREVDALHLYAPPPRPSQSVPVPPAIDDVVLRAMEKQAERRFPSAGAFCEALRTAVDGSRRKPADEGGTVRGVAIYLQARGPNGDGELDENAFEDALSCIEEGEEPLRQAGFSLPLQTGTALLALRLLSDGSEREERKQAVDLAHSLVESLRQAFPKLGISAVVHAGEAQVRLTDGRLELVGGPLASIAQWVPPQMDAAVLVTESAAAD